MKNRKLIIQQLDRKIGKFPTATDTPMPPTGWTKAIRIALGMTLQQLGDRLGITKQSAREQELREQQGNITLQSLRDAAHAMDMELVYAFVPKDGSLDALIERRAKEVAASVVLRTNQTMRLENQENSEAQIKKAIEERATQLKNDMPKILWD